MISALKISNVTQSIFPIDEEDCARLVGEIQLTRGDIAVVTGETSKTQHFPIMWHILTRFGHMKTAHHPEGAAWSSAK